MSFIELETGVIDLLRSFERKIELERREHREKLDNSSRTNELLAKRIATLEHQLEQAKKAAIRQDVLLETQKAAGDFQKEVISLQCLYSTTRDRLAESLDLLDKASQCLEKGNRKRKRRHSFCGPVHLVEDAANLNLISKEASRFVRDAVIPGEDIDVSHLASEDGVIQACKDGDLAFLEARPESSSREYFGKVLAKGLCVAAVHGNADTVHRLMQLGADLSGEYPVDDARGCFPAMHWGAMAGSVGVVKLLMGSVSSPLCDDVSQSGWTSLQLAVIHNHSAVVELLMRQGADLAAVSPHGKDAKSLAEAHNLRRIVKQLSDPNLLFWNASVRANRLYHQKLYAAAAEAYSFALQLAPDCIPHPGSRDTATLHYNHARTRFQQGKHLEALADCDRALELVDGFVKALAQRAECKMALFDFSGAASDYTRLQLSEPGSTEWKFALERAKKLRDMDYYQVLGVAKGCAECAIKTAYHKQCLKWHPDKHRATEEDKTRATTIFKTINEAYSVLSDLEKRHKYDLEKFRQSSGMADDEPYFAAKYSRESKQPRSPSAPTTGGFDPYFEEVRATWEPVYPDDDEELSESDSFETPRWGSTETTAGLKRAHDLAQELRASGLVGSDGVREREERR